MRTWSRTSRARPGASSTIGPGLGPALPRFPPDRTRGPDRERPQVRQPIFRSSLARWRRYEKHLGPLIDALGPEGAASAFSR